MAKLNWIALSLLWSSIFLAGTAEPSMAKNDISTMGVQSDAGVFLDMGYRLMSEGKYDQSVMAYDKAIELNPSLAEAWAGKAEALFNLSDYRGSIQALDRAIELEPKKAMLWDRKGVALLKLELYNDSILALDRAIELDPEWWQPWNDRGAALINLGLFNDSIRSFERAIKLEPERAHPWNGKGYVLFKLELYNASMRSFDKAIELDPELALPWYWKGSAFTGLGLYKDSILSFERAIKLDPEWCQPWNGKGYVFLELGLINDSLQAFNRAIGLNPKWDQPWYGKGLALLNLGLYNASIPYFDKAIALSPEWAQPWNGKGLALAYLGFCNASIPFFDKAIALNPEWAQPWNGKGLALLNLGLYNASIPFFDKAIALSPEWVQPWNGKGLALAYLGFCNASIPFFDKAIALNPEWAQPWNGKGAALLNLGLYNASIPYFDKAIGLSPELALHWNNKGSALLALGRYNESIQAFDRAVELNPESARSWLDKGNAYAMAGFFEDSLHCYEKSLGFNPKLKAAWNGKGYALFNLGRYQEAIAAYDQAIRIDPEFARAWMNKGQVLAAIGEYDEAMEALDEAIMLDPRLMANVWLGRAMVLAGLEKYEEAIVVIEEALKIDPRLAQGWMEKCYLEYLLERNEEAIESADVALAIRPGSAAAWNIRGLALAQLGRYEDAIVNYDQAILLSENYSYPWRNKGLALTKLGRYEEAVRAYDQALKLDPKNSRSWEEKGGALFELGKYEEAVSCFDEAIDLDPDQVMSWIGKYYALSQLGLFYEAMGCFSKAVEIQPVLNYVYRDAVELDFIRGHISRGAGRWEAADFGWFSYDLDQGMGREVLQINPRGRVVEIGELRYSSQVVSCNFMYGPWGSYRKVGLLGKAYLAGYPGSAFADDVSLLERGELREVLQDENEARWIEADSPLHMYDGYMLSVGLIADESESVALILSRNRTVVDEAPIRAGQTYSYCPKSHDGPVILVHVSKLSNVDGHPAARIDGLFQVQDQPSITLYEGLKIDRLVVDNLSLDGVEMSNFEDIALDVGNMTEIARGLFLQIINDSSQLMYYPVGSIVDYGYHIKRGSTCERGGLLGHLFMGSLPTLVEAEWTSDNFTDFFLEDELPGTETMIINGTGNRFIPPARVRPSEGGLDVRGLLYYSTVQKREFQVEEWGSYRSIQLFGYRWFAGCMEQESPELGAGDALGCGRIYRVLADSDDMGNATGGDVYTLEGGYTLWVQRVDPDSIFLSLYTEGRWVDNKTVPANGTYVYRKEMGPCGEVPVIALKVGRIFNNEAGNIVEFNGLFIISEDLSLPVDVGAEFGEMMVIYQDSTGMVLGNKDPLTLSRDSRIILWPDFSGLLEGLSLQIADNDTLRFYPFTLDYVVPSPAIVSLQSPQTAVPAPGAANFSMELLAGGITAVRVDILDSEGRMLSIRDLTPRGEGLQDRWSYNWTWNASILVVGDEKCMIPDIGDGFTGAMLYLNQSSPGILVAVRFDDQGRISRILDPEGNVYYVSRTGCTEQDPGYDLIMNDSILFDRYIKIEPGVSKLGFSEMVEDEIINESNQTLQGSIEALEPRAERLPAPAGMYELTIVVSNVMNTLHGDEIFFNVTSNESPDFEKWTGGPFGNDSTAWPVEAR